MPSPPRLTAADAETLLVSAGFLFLERRGHHRVYGRGRTRVVVPFDGAPGLHPKVVRMIVESMERSRPTTSFEVDKTIVGLSEGMGDAGAWVAADEDLTLTLDAGPVAPAAPVAPRPAPKAAPKPQPVKAQPAPAPQAAAKPAPAAPKADDTITIPPTPVGQPDDPEGSVDLPRKPKPKGAWS